MPRDSYAVPSDRLARLSRCVNISRWFRYPAGPTPEHFLTFITDADLDLITSLGMTGVRLTVSVDQIVGPGNRPLPQTVDCLKRALDRMTARGLAVVVAIYGASGWIEAPFRSGSFVEFWARLANELRGTHPNHVLFEPVNEPIFTVFPGRWRGVEARLAGAIRSAAPHHTLITGGTGWSGIDGLLSHRPLDDPNVVYTFHFYEPHVFTHQGAPWNSGWVTELRNVPYPLTPEAVATTLDSTSPHFRALHRHAAGRYDSGFVERRIRAAAEWGRRYGVPLWAGEFGCYPPYAPRADVLRWFHDVRTSLERNGVGWAVWSYDEELALDRKLIDGRPVIDRDVAAALGLSLVESCGGGARTCD